MAQTVAIENSATRASYSASIPAMASSTSAFSKESAFIVCQLFNDSTNEVGLRSYTILHQVETGHALVCQSYTIPFLGKRTIPLFIRALGFSP